MEDSRKRSSKSKKDPAQGYLSSRKTGGKTDVGEKRKQKGAKSKYKGSSDEDERRKRTGGVKRGRGKRQRLKKAEKTENSSDEVSGASGGDRSTVSSEDEAGTSSDSSIESDSSSSGAEWRTRRKTKKQGKRAGMWELVNEMWPLDTRPKLLQCRRTVEKMTIAEISQFKDHYEKEEEKKGAGSAVYGKDQKLKPVSFKKGKDDGVSKLHPARFELRMPLSVPKKYWHKIPARREVYRHFPLAHLGMEGQVSEATIVRMHDRRVPITLDMLYKGNAGRDSKAEKAEWLEPTEVRHLQEAILNYMVLLNALWPMDYAGAVIMRVLVEANWGVAAGGNEKMRVALVRKFFDETVRDNSGRVVRDEVPLSYEEAKAKWIRVMESVLPGMSLLGATAVALTGAKGKQGPGQQLQQQQPKRGGAGGGRGGSRGGRGGGAGSSAASQRSGAVASGLPVCFQFNLATGCTRDVAGPNACKDAKGMHFAHACNWLDRQTNKFCLQLHSRCGNH